VHIKKILSKCTKDYSIYSTIIFSLKRELFEETGLTIYDPVLRGSFAWMNDRKYIGNLYIFHATKSSGNLHRMCDEGTLAWHPIDSVVSRPDLADHQRGFLPEILVDPLFFYTSVGIYDKHSLVSCTDSKSYFNSRRQ
jgi:8-oxo-dGTP pyrophosphatase MutT (NUDIX family)